MVEGDRRLKPGASDGGSETGPSPVDRGRPDGVPAVRGAIGRPRRRPDSLIADRGYDHDKYPRLLWQRGFKPVIARRQTDHGSGLGRYRWVVERTFAWLHNFKRLLIRYERRADMHNALLALGCCLVCFRRLGSSI
jgi:transposase